MHQEHVRDFRGFPIEHDDNDRTHAEQNLRLSELVYWRLDDACLIFTRDAAQLCDPERQMFLENRFGQAATQPADRRRAESAFERSFPTCTHGERFLVEPEPRPVSP